METRDGHRLPDRLDRERPILVIDDDAIRDLILATLADEGYAVVTATNGASALEQVRRYGPRLIILDINMPVMDGNQFLDAYRETPGPHVPVVICTAAQSAAALADHLAADEYLGKPFDIDDLVHVAGKLAPLADAGPAPQRVSGSA